MIFTIVLNRFNEHEYGHRKGCFKKTTNCRFHYPRTIQESHELKIDFKAEPQFGTLHMEMVKTRHVIRSQWNLRELYRMFS